MSTEIKTPDLEQIAANYKKAVAPTKRRIIICGGTGCIANGSMKVRDAICAELEKAGERVEVVLERKLPRGRLFGRQSERLGGVRLVPCHGAASTEYAERRNNP